MVNKDLQFCDQPPTMLGPPACLRRKQIFFARDLRWGGKLTRC